MKNNRPGKPVVIFNGDQMAKFEGTIQEFHDYIGPRIKNKVNSLTIPHRKNRRGECEHCHQLAELQSAHKHGRERRGIIEQVLSSYELNGLIYCNIREVENLIINEHKIIEDNFLFLCPECHRDYDQNYKIGEKDEQVIPQIQNRNHYNNNPQGNNDTEEFRYFHRIRLWAKHPQQINHKIIQAYLALERNGTVYLDNLRQLCSDRNSPYYIDTFNSNYAQMKTDLGHPHGKVFYDEDGVVYVYRVVREEIRKRFA